MDGLTPAIQQVDLSEYFEEGDDDYGDIKKKLEDDFPETPVKPKDALASSKKQAVLVYLRVRPQSHQEMVKRDKTCFHLVSDKELLAVPPKSSQTYKNSTKNGARESNQKFLFTKIFDAKAAQKELFEETLLPTLTDFFKGQNCLVFTYGVTNSGKTYTVTGTPSQPGILPRTLDVIFNSLNQQQLSSLDIKPKNYCNVMYLTKGDTEKERQRKETLLRMANEQPSGVSTAPSTPLLPPSFEEGESCSDADISSLSKASSYNQSLASKCSEDGCSFEFHDESSVELEGTDGHEFSIWVSFAEIYNEYIYDLLTEAPSTHTRGRPTLKLADDKNHNQFIKGLTEVRVESVEEALLLLKLGIRHRHVAATRLNYQSSRSHSIYTIKLIRVVDTSKPTSALVNRISIVDLAGAERSGKTGATGMRMKEAGRINSSLLTLGKCVEAMKHNQNKKSGEDKVVPFRESKLTRLFQGYFVGKGRGVRLGKITMFVNMSSTASAFDETMHVLKFSALTSKVCPIVKAPLASHSLPGPAPSSHALPFASTATCPPPAAPQPVPTQQVGGVKSEGGETRDDTPNLEPMTFPTAAGECTKCKSLEQELRAVEGRRLEQEFLIRQEVSREFTEQLTEIEEQHTQQLEDQAVELQEMHSKRMALLEHSVKRATRKRKRLDEDEPSDHSLRVENVNLRERVSELAEELTMERNRAASEFHDASANYEAKVVQLNKQIADLGLKLFSTEKEAASLSEKQQEWAEEKALLDGEQRKLEAEVEALRLRVKRNREEVVRSEVEGEQRSKQAQAELVKQCNELKQKVAVAESSREDSVMEMDILQNRISELYAEKDTITSLYEKLHTDTDRTKSDLQFENGQLQAKLAKMEAELENASKSSQELRTKLATAEISLDASKDELEATSQEMQGRISQAIADKESLESTLQELRTQLAAAKSSQETTNGDLQAKLLQKTSENDKLTQSCHELEQELSIAQSNLKSSSEELQAQLKLAASEKEKLLLSHKEIEQTLTATQRELASSNQEWAGKVEAVKMELEATNSALSDSNQECLRQIAVLKADLAKATSSKDIVTAPTTPSQECMGQMEMSKIELASVAAKLAVSKEAIYKLEAEKEEGDREIRRLKKLMERRDAELAELIKHSRTQDENNLINSDLHQAMKQTLKEYEMTLETQSRKIQGLESDGETIQSHNDELEQKCTELAARSQALEGTRSTLKSKVEQLTQDLDGSRRALSQREAELQETGEKTCSALEAQVATLQQQVTSLEQELATAREDRRATLERLNAKESELVELAKCVGEEKGEIALLRTQLKESQDHADKLITDHSNSVDILTSQHWLERAELELKLKAAVGELDSAKSVAAKEVQSVKEEHTREQDTLSGELKQAEKRLAKLKDVESENKTLKKSTTQLKKEITAAFNDKKKMEGLTKKISLLEKEKGAWQQEVEGLQKTVSSLQSSSSSSSSSSEGVAIGSSGSSTSLASQAEHIYEEPPEPDEPTLYETVLDDVSSVEPPSAVLKPIENTGRRSYLAAMAAGGGGIQGNTTGGESGGHPELDRSKPFVPLLERSSMLVDESFATGVDKIVIDATPLPVRKKAARRGRKRSNEAAENSSPAPATSAKKPKIYPLRSRKAPIVEVEETDSIKDFTPQSQWKFKLPGRKTGKKDKGKGKASQKSTEARQTPPRESPLDVSSIASRTARRKRVRKSQISQPLELMLSPSGKTGHHKLGRLIPPRPTN